MKERPILFSAPMVRAILEWRKTQTRRVVQSIGNDEGFVIIDYGNGGWPYRSDDGDSTTHTIKRGGKLYLEETPHACPYGQPGDRLWVRETWQGPLLDSEEHEAQFHDDGPEAFQKPGFCAYRATDSLDAIGADGNEIGWRPSIHMPRWASRINLEITGVRVERLQDISRADAIAEGAPPSHPSIDRVSSEYGFSDFLRSWYAQLWEQINGPGSWDANPWVWVVEFKRVES